MVNYSSYLPGYQPAITQQPGILWVPGIEGARSYPVANGNAVLLMDQNAEDVFYIKEMDLSGMPKIRTFKYKEVHDKSNPEYVTKDDFDKAITELKKIMEKGDK